jgi:predicted metal-dependent peptidase
MSSTTLLNPKNLLSEKEYLYLDEKLNVTKMVTSRSPERGGSPFIYSFATSKKHILDNTLKVELKNGKFHYTVGTDGESYYWHPEVLKNFTVRELNILLIHETYHIILDHANPQKLVGRDPDIWGIAIDYVVNAIIEHDFIKNGWIEEPDDPDDDDYYYDNYYQKNIEHQIWNGSFGGVITFKQLKNSIETIKKGRPLFNDNIVKTFADYSLHGMSAEQVYDKIVELIKPGKNKEDGKEESKNKNKSEEDIKKELLNNLSGSTLDNHNKLQSLPATTIHKEMLNAASLAQQMGQSLPGEIERQLLKLQNPSLKWEDIIRMLFQNIRKNFGNFNDWTRFRRRSLSCGLYRPVKKDKYIKWVALIDTSGSMSEEDISYALSQLKVIDGRSEGTIIPVDDKVYWDKATNIKNISDLSKTKLSGGGFTCFSDFFNNYKDKLKSDFDVLIILTDGMIFDIDVLKKPHCETVWVIDNKYYGLEGFKFDPPFGRVAPVRRN